MPPKKAKRKTTKAKPPAAPTIVHETKEVQTDAAALELAETLHGETSNSNPDGSDAHPNRERDLQLSILIKHVSKLTEENSLLRRRLESTISKARPLPEQIRIFKTECEAGQDYVKSELRVMSAEMKANCKTMEADMKKEYEKLLDKCKQKDARLAKQREEKAELVELQQKVADALDTQVRNLQIVRKESNDAIVEARELDKKLKDRLYLADNQKCTNCAVKEQVKNGVTDQLADKINEYNKLQTLVAQKNLELASKEETNKWMAGRLCEVQKELKEAQTKANYSTASYSDQLQKSQARVRELEKRLRAKQHVGGWGTPPEIMANNGASPPVIIEPNMLTPPEESNEEADPSSKQVQQTQPPPSKPPFTVQRMRGNVANKGGNPGTAGTNGGRKPAVGKPIANAAAKKRPLAHPVVVAAEKGGGLVKNGGQQQNLRRQSTAPVVSAEVGAAVGLALAAAAYSGTNQRTGGNNMAAGTVANCVMKTEGAAFGQAKKDGAQSRPSSAGGAVKTAGCQQQQPTPARPITTTVERSPKEEGEIADDAGSNGPSPGPSSQEAPQQQFFRPPAKKPKPANPAAVGSGAASNVWKNTPSPSTGTTFALPGALSNKRMQKIVANSQSSHGIGTSSSSVAVRPSKAGGGIDPWMTPPPPNSRQQPPTPQNVLRKCGGATLDDCYHVDDDDPMVAWPAATGQFFGGDAGVGNSSWRGGDGAPNSGRIGAGAAQFEREFFPRLNVPPAADHALPSIYERQCPIVPPPRMNIPRPPERPISAAWPAAMPPNATLPWHRDPTNTTWTQPRFTGPPSGHRYY